jgi:replicative DNA helicase
MIPELDKVILAYALGEKRLALTLQTTINNEYFHPSCQIFYKLFMLCFDKYNEPPTPKVMEEQAGALWSKELLQTFHDILKISYDVKEFPSDLEKFKIRHNKNVLLKVGKEIFKDNWDGEEFSSLSSANAGIKKLVATLDSIYGNKIYKEGSLSETADEASVEYNYIQEHPEVAVGIKLGLREFDRITNGLHSSELMLVGGESSSGKSALCMQMALNAWRGQNIIPETVEEVQNMQINNSSGANILFFTIEMPFKVLRRRINSCLAGIPLYGLRDGNLTQQEYNKFAATIEFQKRFSKQFHIVDIPRGCTMAQVESKYIEKCHEYQPDLLIIDYISLMTPDKEQGSDWLNIGRLSEQLHEFCRTYGVATISPVQLNRPNKQKDGMEPPTPDQHRVGRSIMLTQNSNILLNIKTRKDEHLKPDMEIQIAKMRDGEKGAFILHKRLDKMQIYDDVPGWTPQEYNVLDGYEPSEE